MYVASVALLPYAIFKTLWAFEVPIGVTQKAIEDNACKHGSIQWSSFQFSVSVWNWYYGSFGVKRHINIHIQAKERLLYRVFSIGFWAAEALIFSAWLYAHCCERLLHNPLILLAMVSLLASKISWDVENACKVSKETSKYKDPKSRNIEEILDPELPEIAAWFVRTCL